MAPLNPDASLTIPNNTQIGNQQASQSSTMEVSSNSSNSAVVGTNATSNGSTTATPLPIRRQRSTAKRPRSGEKNDPFVLPPCDLPPIAEMQPVVTFLQSAILKPKEDAYSKILECIRRRRDPTLTHRLFLALRTNGPTLHQIMTHPIVHAHLLHLVFRYDPFCIPNKMATDEAYQTLVYSFELSHAHLQLCVAMVSCNSTFLLPALNALWKLLINVDPKFIIDDLSEGRIKRLHAAIATLLRLVPKGTTDLFPVMAGLFPFRSRPNLKEYSIECLHVLQYAPTMEGQVLELLIDKALEMDVEIKIKSTGDVEIDNAKHVKKLSDDDDAIFDLELDDVDAAAELEKQKKLREESKSLEERRIDEMADKLDSMMLLIFQHVADRVQKKPEVAPILFQMLIPVFESTILTTHRSKYVQFVLFHLCGVNTTTAMDLERDFAGHLIEGVLDHSRAVVTRQSAACYLASFVSRAKYVCAETACEAVCALLRWAEAYLEAIVVLNWNKNDVRSMCETHTLFYTVCQAAYYIMCFRGVEAIQFYREAVEYHSKNPIKTEDSPYPDLDHIDMAPERWEKICSHKLQPLRFCLESVREEFILVAQVFHLLPPALSKNLDIEAQQQSSRPAKRKIRGKSIHTKAVTVAGRRRKGGVGGLGRGSNPLDSFFPFDPYLLQRSHEFIDPLYRNWEGSIEEETTALEIDNDVEDAMDEDDSDDDDDDSSCDDDRTHMTASVESTTSFLETYNGSVVKNSPSEYHQAQQEAWSNALKRPRAPSIAENGSW